MSAFWHPFANMGKVDRNKFTIERGEGIYVYDDSGRELIDGTAALWFCQIGYGRSEIGQAVSKQIGALHTYHTFGDYSNHPVEQAAERVASLAPMPGSKVFFTSGGSDSVDTAAKLTRRYFHEIGQPDRTVFIVRDWAYHGMHAYGTSFAGLDPNLEGHGPMVEDVVKVAWDSLEDLEEAVEQIGAGRVAGLFAEPIIGAGGIRFPPEGYLKGAQQLMHDAGAFFIADEVITGFGRVGAWFASTRFGLDPDLITFAKGVTSGYLPMGGVVASARVAEPFWKSDGNTIWRHGYTYSGHASVAAAALVNLDILDSEGIVEGALSLESELFEAIASLASHSLVADIRTGPGVLAAVQLVGEDMNLAARAADACRENGLITRAIAGGALQLSPPLIITREQLDEVAERMYAALEAVA